MTRLLTAAPVVRKVRPNTDILVQPRAAQIIRQTHPEPRKYAPKKRKINYAKKIVNDPFIFNV